MEDDRFMLVQELRDLLGLRFAIVLAPAFRVLVESERADLGACLKRFVGPMANDLEDVLSRYQIRRKDGHDDM